MHLTRPSLMIQVSCRKDYPSMKQFDFCLMDLENDRKVSNLLSFQDNRLIQNFVNIMPRRGRGGDDGLKGKRTAVT